MELEQCSPQLLGAAAELWRDFIRRDVPTYASTSTPLPEPANPHSWARLYRKLRRQAERAVQDDAAALQAAMRELGAAKAARTSRVVEARAMPKLPRMGGMRVEKGSVRSVGGIVGGAGPSRPTTAYKEGSRVKKVTGRAMLDKVRKEAKAFHSLAAPKASPTAPGAGPMRQIGGVVVRAPRRSVAAGASTASAGSAAAKKENEDGASGKASASGTSHAATSKASPKDGESELGEGTSRASEKLPEQVAYHVPKPKSLSARAASPMPAVDASPPGKPALVAKRKPPDSIFMPQRKRR